MEEKKASTVTINYELYTGIAIDKADFEKLEAQIKKICEIHDGKHTVHIDIKNQFVTRDYSSVVVR